MDDQPYVDSLRYQPVAKSTTPSRGAVYGCATAATGGSGAPGLLFNGRLHVEDFDDQLQLDGGVER